MPAGVPPLAWRFVSLPIETVGSKRRAHLAHARVGLKDARFGGGEIEVSALRRGDQAVELVAAEAAPPIGLGPDRRVGGHGCSKEAGTSVDGSSGSGLVVAQAETATAQTPARRSFLECMGSRLITPSSYSLASATTGSSFAALRAGA